MTTRDEMLPGARTAIIQCLGISSDDRVFIMTDDETLPIGEALLAVAAAQGATCRMIRLEEFGRRPFLAPLSALVEELRAFAPTATLFAAQGQPGEIAFRIPLGLFLQNDLPVRHGHMIGITPRLMRSGMTVNYDLVAAMTMRVYHLVRESRTVRVRNDDGTDLVATLDPTILSWAPWTGLYRSTGDWGNLPEGETFTSPVDVEGLLTARLLGDYFSHKYGLLDDPVVIHLKAGHAISLEHPNVALAHELWSYLNSVPYGTRIGEFAIGTNYLLTELTGNLLQDEKYPGLHVAFGDPYQRFTKATWSSSIHVDVIPLRTSIWVDDRQIMNRGHFILPEAEPSMV